MVRHLYDSNDKSGLKLWRGGMNVVFERFMELFKRKKKMVAAAHHHSIALVQPAYYFQRFGNSTFYLHAFLGMVTAGDMEFLNAHT